MKKALIALSIILLISGCGEETKTLSCKMTDSTRALTTNTEYNIKYINDEVKKVIITYDYNNTRNSDDVDGTNADTDGLDQNTNTDNNDNTLESDDVVDGVVGDAIDGTVNGIKDTILDLAGIKDTYQNQMSDFDNMEGFTYRIDKDNDNEYKIIYEIDLDKINDTDLNRFDIDKSFTTLETNLNNQGYICK